MPAGPLSRYRDLPAIPVRHATRGDTRSLPIRRPLAPPPPVVGRHRVAAYEPADLLARRFLGREELLWRLLDANGGRAPDAFVPGEVLAVPSPDDATRVRRDG